MKSFKSTFHILPILLFMVLVSCKKDKINLENQDPNNPVSTANVVTAGNLEDYYIVGERSTQNRKLVLIYFTKEANVVKANVHLSGALRVADAKVNNSKFSFDFDADGSFVFNFDLVKDASGTIRLKNYQYIDRNNNAINLNYAVLVKKADCPQFKSYGFKSGDLIFNLNNTNAMEWDIKLRQVGIKLENGVPVPILLNQPEFTLPFYTLNNLGFKSNNDEFIGLSVPNWKGLNTPLLLVERAGIVTSAIKR